MFRLLSKQAAVVFHLLVSCHTTFPFRMFRLLEEPGLAADIRLQFRNCPGSFDEWSKSFMDYYEDIASMEALLELAVLVILGRTSTVKLEAFNAKLRKILKSRSNQVKAPRLGDISNEFMLSRIRVREGGLWKRVWTEWKGQRNDADSKQRTCVRKKLKRRKKGNAKIEKKKKRPGGGGAWRAYCSKKCRGVAKGVWKALAVEFKRLSP